MLADWAGETYGKDYASDTWYYLSPLSYTDLITNPVLILCATGDMLVPIEQMTREHVRPFDPKAFPEGYKRDFDELAPSDKTRVCFEEVLPKDQRYVAVVPRQERSFELTLGHFMGVEPKPKSGPDVLDRSWSPKHQWSLCYLDEGPPTPHAAHTSHEWVTWPKSFSTAQIETPIAPEALTAPKLVRLMERYARKRSNLPKLADGMPANRLNFPGVEQRDVIAGLLDYAGVSETHAKRLVELYADCPLKPLGDTIDLDLMQRRLREAPKEKQSVQGESAGTP